MQSFTIHRRVILLLSLAVIVSGEALAFQASLLLSLKNNFDTVTNFQTGPRYHEKYSIVHRRRRNHGSSSSSSLAMIGTGFSFNDGEQILVSVQKPLGIILEQDSTPSDMSPSSQGPITVTDVDLNGSAARAGVQVGDTLLAVQNVSVEFMDLNEVLDLIGGAPRVLNLRFLRREREE
ncbi:hypothetical protein HJC23_013472 [Cyclotella cryptica]|uniref:PDZ domain-containing protein n=1 Tax=Cyclotella cryptica TaxID=29204 RepID=A0ABD3QHZ4_9STRA|eukprot:CCRYP_006883-RA/>CCRYP_006883-RA protein AED:0.47 eAED:0.47 QI:0/-1/0/1/-1/1/1/0/177